MMIMEAIRSFIAGCPLLRDGYLHVDYLGADPTEYVIESTPADGVIKQYADGGALKQFVFVFGSREYYGADVIGNLANSAFYEQFAAWLEDQNKTGNLPELGEGKTVQKIETTTTGYLLYGDANTARYQIQCRLIYFEGGKY